MKFAILFEAPGIGVYTLHEDQDGADRHIRFLKNMNPGTQARWSILHEGQEIASSRPAKQTKPLPASSSVVRAPRERVARTPEDFGGLANQTMIDAMVQKMEQGK